MKRAVWLIFLFYLFSGCVSVPKDRAPVGNSYGKLIRAKEIRCLSSKSASSFVTDEGELISRNNPLERDVDKLPWRISIKPLPGDDRATIHLEIEGHEAPEIPLIYTSVVRK